MRLKDALMVLATVAIVLSFARPHRPPLRPKPPTTPEVTESPSLEIRDWYSEIAASHERYPERAHRDQDWSPEENRFEISGIQVGTGRGLAERILGGRLAPHLQLDHTSVFYTLCRACGASPDLRAQGLCSHSKREEMNLTFDEEGYVAHVSGIPLRRGKMELSADISISDAEELLGFKGAGIVREGYITYPLRDGGAVILFTEDGRVRSAALTSRY